jgi:hypothetical protein
MRVWISFALFAILALPLRSHGQTDDAGTALDAARREYQAAQKQAKDALLAEFDKKAAEVRKGSLAADKKVSVLEAILQEREQFVLEETLPTSVLMKAAVAEYKRRMDPVLSKLDAAYVKAIDTVMKAGDNERAKALVKERKAAILGEGHELVGDWWLDGKDGAGFLERWTIAKSKGGAWSVTGRYYSGDGKRLVGECIGRDMHFEDGTLTCRQIWLTKPDPNWKSGNPLTFKAEGAEAEQLTLGTTFENPMRLVRKRK